MPNDFLEEAAGSGMTLPLTASARHELRREITRGAALTRRRMFLYQWTVGGGFIIERQSRQPPRCIPQPCSRYTLHVNTQVTVEMPARLDRCAEKSKSQQRNKPKRRER